MQSVNYALRYLMRRRGNSLARLLSLALGLIVALLIFSYVGFVLSYNRFFPDRDRIWQVWIRSPKYGLSEKMVRPLAPNLAADLPQIEAATHCTDARMQITCGEARYDCYGYYAGPDFFDVLDFGVVSGDPHRILSAEGRAAGEVMISERLAERLFGKEDPLGRTLGIEQGAAWTVAGIFRTPPVNSTFGRFEFVAWLPYDAERENWEGNDSFPTFIKLRAGADIAEVEASTAEFDRRHGIAESRAEWQESYLFVTLAEAAFTDNERRQMSYLYSVIGVVALLVACLNYVLLTVSSLAERSRTIAMMRCTGARRSDIFRMLLAETLAMVLVAALAAAFLIACLHVEIGGALGYAVGDLFAFERIWIPAAVCLAAFLAAGLLPAALFSAVDLHYAFRRGSDNRTWWKRSLLFVQVACTTAIVLFLAVTVRQANHIYRIDLGYAYDRLVTATIPGRASTLSTIVDELRKLPAVEDASYAGGYPLWGYSGMPCVDEEGHILFSCRWECCDEHYVPTMGMRIVEGRNLLPTDPTDRVLVNETYVRLREWEGSAVGRTIRDSGGAYEIVGVVADYRMAGGGVLPIVLHPLRSELTNPEASITLQLSIRLRDLAPETIAEAKAVIDRYYESDWQWGFVLYRARLENAFRQLRDIRNGMAAVALVTLVIALSGLVGFIGNEMQRRRKEIAIRTVNGATAGDVLRLVGRNLTAVVLPAVAVGTAAAVWGGIRFLEAVGELRADVPWWLYAGGIAVVLAIVYAIQLLRTWRTAAANPIDMIKTE